MGPASGRGGAGHVKNHIARRQEQQTPSRLKGGGLQRRVSRTDWIHAAKEEGPEGGEGYIKGGCAKSLTRGGWNGVEG